LCFIENTQGEMDEHFIEEIFILIGRRVRPVAGVTMDVDTTMEIQHLEQHLQFKFTHTHTKSVWAK